MLRGDCSLGRSLRRERHQSADEPPARHLEQKARSVERARNADRPIDPVLRLRAHGAGHRFRDGEANVFHLLWSPHSAASAECHKEWIAALQREPSERFIKQWFWRKPLSAPPAEFVAHHISFKYEREG